MALQLASTQFSPRLLRNFLRDRTNQVVLSVFVATFTYSTAGLFTVGVSAGQRVEDYPRLAVSFALVLLFVSLLMLVFFVHHLAHSIQIDEVMRRVERSTLRVIEHDLPTQGVSADPAPSPPAWARRGAGVPVRVGPDACVPSCSCRWPRSTTWWRSVSTMVGEFVVEGAPLLWVWAPSAGRGAPDPATFARGATRGGPVGFERTAEQDVAFGVRQLADIAVKALSPAINDPYTAIQALEHLGVLLASLVRRPLGSQRLHDDAGTTRVVVPGRDLSYYLDLATGQIRRYGCAEPRVDRALLRVLATTGAFCATLTTAGSSRCTYGSWSRPPSRSIQQQADLVPVREHAGRVLRRLTA